MNTMACEEQIRVVVVDDHDLVRSGLVALLAQEQDIVVVGEASNGLEGKNTVAVQLPHIVLMDVKMPVMDGIAATTSIVKECPGVKVIMVTHLANEVYARKFMRSGASGYVPKSCAAQELKHAIREVYAGRQYCSPTIVPAPIQIRTGPGPNSPLRDVSLTPREREVLRLVASGNSNLEISTALQISIRTVEFHRANLIEKIGAKDAISLVRCAIEQHLIQLEPVTDQAPPQ